MRIWRRSAWKRLAGVVRLQTIQLISNNCLVMICSTVSSGGAPGSFPGRWTTSSSQSLRKRSIFPDECSGPWPSIPWGNKRTSPTCLPHFACPEHKSVSGTTYANHLFYSFLSIHARLTHVFKIIQCIIYDNADKQTNRGDLRSVYRDRC